MRELIGTASTVALPEAKALREYEANRTEAVALVNDLLNAAKTLPLVQKLVIERLRDVREEAETRSQVRAFGDLVQKAGGIFVGPNELVQLGLADPGLRIAPLPTFLTEGFLRAEHPTRNGTVGSHLLLGYSAKSGQWHCIDRGTGGPGDRPLKGEKTPAHVGEAKFLGSSQFCNTEALPSICEVINAAIKLHQAKGGSPELSPFNAHPGIATVVRGGEYTGTIATGALNIYITESGAEIRSRTRSELNEIKIRGWVRLNPE